jgi:hypothetical protein
VTERIRFAGEQGELTIDVHAYERPDASDRDDANWLSCEIAIKAGPFAGTFRCAFTTFDLLTLAERLSGALKVLSGTVSFQNTEQDIDFQIDFDKRGTAILRGEVRSHRSPEISLGFRFDSDQTYLAQSLRQTETVLRKFPVRQAL